MVHDGAQHEQQSEIGNANYTAREGRRGVDLEMVEDGGCTRRVVDALFGNTFNGVAAIAIALLCSTFRLQISYSHYEKTMQGK